MTTTTQADTAQEERIVRLFAEGHGIDFVCERGHYAGTNGWNRARVLEVVSRRGWTLDGSGRVPRQDRPAVTPGKPVPRVASGKTSVGMVGGGPVVVPVPRPSPGRGQVQSLIERVDASVASSPTKTPTKTPTKAGAVPAPADAVGTAPAASAAVTGRRAPDAAPQVSPPRTHTEDGGERGASEAPATPPAATPDDTDVEPMVLMAPVGQPCPPTAPAGPVDTDLLERAATHPDERIRDLAAQATGLLAQIRGALARDDARAELRARLAALDAERDTILARLAEPLLPEPAPAAVELHASADELAEQLRHADWPDTAPAPSTPPAVQPPAVPDTTGGKCGTWGGFLRHRYRGQTADQIADACPPCHAAKATRGRAA